MKYACILFDLDGTLTDSEEGITRCVQYALNHFGIKEDDKEALRRFIGPPLFDSFSQYYHLPEDKAREAVTKYRERYETIGMFENKVYEGITDVLRQLRQDGYTIILATSKPEVYANTILKRFLLAPFFHQVVGATMDGKRDYKIDILKEIMRKNPQYEASQFLMVGDRRYDIEGAKGCHMDSIGVTYGFGTEEELQNAGATYIAKRPEEIVSIVFQKGKDGEVL